MRNAPTPAEARLAELLSRLLPSQGQVERQWAFGEGSKRFILDLFIPQIRLGIEVDGAHHGSPHQKHIDKAKQSVAKAQRITICRIGNHKCLSSSDDELTQWLREAWVQASKAQREWKSSR
jgi:very-short-patch-repair endonuclease